MSPSPERATGPDSPLIVGGCHRSGTSLVRRVLDSHSRIHCGPELKFFRDLYGDYLTDPLWRLRFSQTARDWLGEDELLEVLGGGFLELHRRAALAAGRPRWADKAPENVLYTTQWQRLLGDDWLLIHVVRNPLDTIASLGEAGFTSTLPDELDARIAHYRRYVEAGLRFAAEEPERYRRVTYERLILEPEKALQELMSSIGERLEPGQLHFNEQAHQAGLEDPKIAATSQIHRGSLHRWTGVLTEIEAARVWEATADIWAELDPGLRYVQAPPASPAVPPAVKPPAVKRLPDVRASKPGPGPEDSQLVHEQQLYDRVFALTNALDQAREQRRQLDTDLRVAQIALERAQRSRAWRFGHGLSRLGRALTQRRRAAGRSDALQTAAEKLSGLEQTGDLGPAGLDRDR